MNTDFVLNEWCPALRSGEYRQGSYVLREVDDTYCCLGVACDLLAKRGIGKWGKKSVRPRTYISPDRHWSRQKLPRDVAAMIGVVSEWGPPCEIGGIRYPDLSQANDAGRSFGEIADALEALALAERPDA